MFPRCRRGIGRMSGTADRKAMRRDGHRLVRELLCRGSWAAHEEAVAPALAASRRHRRSYWTVTGKQLQPRAGWRTYWLSPANVLFHSLRRLRFALAGYYEGRHLSSAERK